MNLLTTQAATGRASEMDLLRRLASDEDGAAYTLSYVMVIPLYALLICMIIESVLMMTAKLGTVYSAYAAARTATVWSSATTWENTQKKAEEAAFKSMTPFASGTNLSFRDVASVPAAEEAGRYWVAYQGFAKDPVSHTYLLAKYSYARQNVRVKFAGPPSTWKSDVKVTVSYDFPFNVPGIGRLFGKPKFNGTGIGYYYTISSEVSLANEGPKDGLKTIGIGYGTLE